MKYKMVVSDFDGTLLRKDMTISRRTVEAIEKYIARGGVFTVSTGRMNASIRHYLAELGLGELNLPLMSYQGALVEESLTRKRLFSASMDLARAEAIALEFERLGLYFQVYDFDRLYVAEKNYLNEIYCEKTKVAPEVVGKLSDFIARQKPEIVKILSIVDENKTEEFFRHFRDGFSDGAEWVISGPMLYEAFSDRAGKGTGLTVAAKRLGIDLGEVMAIGDSHNDLSMLAAAGLGVAVANAREEVLAAADYVTASNDEDGVAKAIETFCLED